MESGAGGLGGEDVAHERVWPGGVVRGALGAGGVLVFGYVGTAKTLGRAVFAGRNRFGF